MSRRRLLLRQTRRQQLIEHVGGVPRPRIHKPEQETKRQTVHNDQSQELGAQRVRSLAAQLDRRLDDRGVATIAVGRRLSH